MEAQNRDNGPFWSFSLGQSFCVLGVRYVWSRVLNQSFSRMNRVNTRFRRMNETH